MIDSVTVVFSDDPRHDEQLRRLALSQFRSQFHLLPADRGYALEKGETILRAHAAGFISSRLAPADIPNDGKQTPMKGHPVFTAQHACACCCRGCLEKWHHIPKGRALTSEEQSDIVELLLDWIRHDLTLPSKPKRPSRQAELF